MISMPIFMAALNFVLALCLLVQCLLALNRISDQWSRFAIHLVLGVAGGLIAFRAVDVSSEIAFDDRMIVGRFLLNLALIAAWILIHRNSHKAG